MPRWKWHWRRRGRGRPFAPIFIYSKPMERKFIPQPYLNSEPIQLTYPEFEAVRLIDLNGLTQEETAKKLNVSRGTVWRLLQSGRKKIIQALAESRPLILTAEQNFKVD